jgi:hypothetical protein
MSQGDFVKINSTTEVDAKVKHLQKRLRDWDYQSPCCIRLTAYRNPASMDQVALFNMWCREIAQAMKKRTPSADAEAWKVWLKRKFVGTDTYKVGKDTIVQVKPTPKSKVGMCKFMSAVLVFADDKLNVRLSVPRNSEFVDEQRKVKESEQKAAQKANDTAGSGKGSSATPKAGKAKGEQQIGLL